MEGDRAYKYKHAANVVGKDCGEYWGPEESGWICLRVGNKGLTENFSSGVSCH